MNPSENKADKKKREIPPIPILYGKNINLILPSQKLTKMYTIWLNSHRTRRYLRNPIPELEEDMKNWMNIVEESDRYIEFDIYHKEDKKRIGNTGLMEIDPINRDLIKWYEESGFIRHGIKREAIFSMGRYRDVHVLSYLA